LAGPNRLHAAVSGIIGNEFFYASKKETVKKQQRQRAGNPGVQGVQPGA
jgi:hypothetical protein